MYKPSMVYFVKCGRPHATTHSVDFITLWSVLDEEDFVVRLGLVIPAVIQGTCERFFRYAIKCLKICA